MTSVNENQPGNNGKEPDKSSEHHDLAETLVRRARARRIHKARRLGERLIIEPDGSRVFIRFNRSQSLEHWVLLGSFTALAFTGLLQRYADLSFVAFLINILGGVETLRTVHHLAALISALQSIYHIGQILIVWLVHRELGSMWPRIQDFLDLVQMMLFNLRLAKTKPAHDRFSIEEKIEYWALIWGTVLMGITGFMQWFPSFFTKFLPGQVVPIARSLHSWEAVLATLAILTWHMYHTVIKEKNTSIFTGKMSEEEMFENHNKEYQRIMAANNYLENINSIDKAVKPIDGADSWESKEIDDVVAVQVD